MTKYVIEYVRHSDYEAGCPDVKIRWYVANSEDEVRQRIEELDPDSDIHVCSISTEEDYRKYTETILNAPDTNLEDLAP